MHRSTFRGAPASDPSVQGTQAADHLVPTLHFHPRIQTPERLLTAAFRLTRISSHYGAAPTRKPEPRQASVSRVELESWGRRRARCPWQSWHARKCVHGRTGFVPPHRGATRRLAPYSSSNGDVLAAARLVHRRTSDKAVVQPVGAPARVTGERAKRAVWRPRTLKRVVGDSPAAGIRCTRNPVAV
jgi:hypothetical protein